jgi:hypothetical protein
VYCSVFALIAFSLIEGYVTITHIIVDLEKIHDILLGGALAVALVPYGAMVYWIYKLISQWSHIHQLRGVEILRDEANSGRAAHQIAARLSGVGFWMCAAFCAALALAVVVLGAMGTGEQGTGVALQLTGRLSLLLFWPAYTFGAMATLFGPRFRILAQRGREFGLAYASAHLVHVGLVAHVVSISGRPMIEAIMPFFSIGVVWTYVLAFSSWERFSKLLGRSVRVLRYIGLEYLALVFFSDLVLLPIRTYTNLPLEYLPFSILIIFGPILRVAAAIQGSRPLWYARSS